MSEEEGDARRHFKEGQRFVTPINGDSTRGFYESLLAEKPHSHLAVRYCVENGLFPPDKHEALLAQYLGFKSSGIFNANRLAMQRIAEKTAPKRELKRELTGDSERSAKKHKKEKKKHKKDKKKKRD